MKRNQINIPIYYPILMILFVFWNSIAFVSSSTSSSSSTENATNDERTGDATVTEYELFESLVMRLLEATDVIHGLSDRITRKQAEKIATKLQSISKDPYTIDFLIRTKDKQDKLLKHLNSSQIVYLLLKSVEEIEQAEAFFRKHNPLVFQKEKMVRLYNKFSALAATGSFIEIHKKLEPVANKGYTNIMQIVIAATVSAVAVPVFLTTAVGAIGFTSLGITGGSYAAGMMSTAALANGGGIAVGSTVAILQSIGAIGISFYSKTVAAIVGGTIASGMWNVTKT